MISKLNLSVKLREQGGRNGAKSVPLSSWLDSVFLPGYKADKIGQARGQGIKKSSENGTGMGVGTSFFKHVGQDIGTIDNEAQTYPSAYADGQTSQQKDIKGEPPIEVEVTEEPDDAQTRVNKLIAEHPDMNASTLLNTLRAEGFIIVKGEVDSLTNKKPAGTEEDRHGFDNDSGKDKDPDARFGFDKQEGDTASAAGNAPFLRGRESKKCDMKVTFGKRIRAKESSARDNGIGWTRFEVDLIEEGLGNLHDGFYYTKEALKSAVPIFEGIKLYADHPDKLEEQTRPERSVRDVLGNYENVKYSEAADGLGVLSADLVVLGDKPYEWARGLLRHAVEFSEKYPDKNFVGLSINAGGIAAEMSIEEFKNAYDIPKSALLKFKEAEEKGIEEIRIVTAFDEATSCDLVTEAGAGGKINKFKESLKGGEMKKFKTRFAEAKKALLKEQGSDVAPSDQEVIKKMMRNELSEMGYEMDDAGMDECMEMYDKAKKEMDKDDEGAMGLVKDMVKMHKMMQKPNAQECDDIEEMDKDDEMGDNKESKGGSAHAIKQAAKIATLESRLNTRDTNDYVDRKLRESKLPRSVTKQFKESAGKIMSEKDFDTKWKIFTESMDMAFKAAGETSARFLGKESSFGGGEADGGGFDFSNCKH